MHKSKMEIFFKRKIVTQNFILSYLYRYHYLLSLSLVKDRKSTRLNSSHLVISYAVFCLKKKNILAFTGLFFGKPPRASRLVGLRPSCRLRLSSVDCLLIPTRRLPLVYFFA